MGSVTAANHRFTTPTAAPVHAAPRLQVDKVSLRYQKPDGGIFTALEKVSFEVPDQQFAVLVGPSGCGKSSLLYLTAGLAEPTEGEIYVGGQQVEGPGADRGMVFQSYTLFPWLTVRQNVEFGLKRRGMPAAQRKEIVDYYVNEVGLTGFADNYAKQLSGGMMQRVAIARALANDPQILLMDEPFGALDSQTRRAFGAHTAKPWFWLVIMTTPLSRSCTGWLAPWWPWPIFRVLAPEARASSW